MRKILYKKRQSLKYRRKMISMNEFSEDKECQTQVRKSFIYIVTRVTQVAASISAPEIFVNKCFNTKLQVEKFSFRVKGVFYMRRGRHIFKVDFCHTLKINIKWKNTIFSPNKPVTLT